MDYFSVKQNYYTGGYDQVLKDVAKQDDQSDDTLLYYKAKSQMALGTYESVGSVSELGKCLDAYHEFLSSKDLSQLEKLTSKSDATPFELLLIASAKCIANDFEKSLELCVQGIDNDVSVGTVELLLLAVEVALLNEQNSVANTMYDNFVNAHSDEISSEDELIVNVAESYIKFSNNKNTSTSNFYHFEEMAQSFPTWKTQLGLLNLQLQQGNTTQAEETIKTLESDFYSKEQSEGAKVFKADFLANKITLDIMKGDNKADELRKELAVLAPDHAFVKTNKEINMKFDEIVAKYSS